jgi:hypothetical protein
MPDDRDRIPAPPGFQPVKEGWYDQEKDVIKVCHGFTCSKRKAKNLLQILKQSFANKPVQVIACPCTGNCRKSNNVIVNRSILHQQVPERIADNVNRELQKQQKEKAKPNSGMSEKEADDILGI